MVGAAPNIGPHLGWPFEEVPVKLYFDDIPFDGQLQRSVG